jgi:hypothetical protein
MSTSASPSEYAAIIVEELKFNLSAFDFKVDHDEDAWSVFVSRQASMVAEFINGKFTVNVNGATVVVNFDVTLVTPTNPEDTRVVLSTTIVVRSEDARFKSITSFTEPEYYTRSGTWDRTVTDRSLQSVVLWNVCDAVMLLNDVMKYDDFDADDAQ